MNFEVGWDVVGNVLHLKLKDKVTIQDFEQIDVAINKLLEETQNRISLIIDLTEAKSVPFPDAHVKASQTYARNSKMRRIIVVGTNKLLRLMVMLTYTLSQPTIHYMDNFEAAKSYLQVTKSNF